MIVLVLDTSTTTPVVAVRRADGSLAVAPTDMPAAARHGRRIVPFIRDALQAAGVAVPDLIGVGMGPGSFTGLRVGLTAAKTLAYAWDRPLVGFDSFEAIANLAGWSGQAVVLADAQRGGIFAGRFHRESPTAPVRSTGAMELVDASAWPAALGTDVLVLTPDPDRLAKLARDAGVKIIPRPATPTADAVIALTLRAAEQGSRLDLFFAEPGYGRRSAAEEKAPATP